LSLPFPDEEFWQRSGGSHSGSKYCAFCKRTPPLWAGECRFLLSGKDFENHPTYFFSLMFSDPDIPATRLGTFLPAYRPFLSYFRNQGRIAGERVYSFFFFSLPASQGKGFSLARAGPSLSPFCGLLLFFRLGQLQGNVPHSPLNPFIRPLPTSFAATDSFPQCIWAAFILSPFPAGIGFFFLFPMEKAAARP